MRTSLLLLVGVVAGTGRSEPYLNSLPHVFASRPPPPAPFSHAFRHIGLSRDDEDDSESIQLGQPLKAVGTPCCLDTLMPGVCRQLYNRDHERFSTQCRTNPDFSFIQCCHSCHFHSEIFTSLAFVPTPNDLYELDAKNMLLNPTPHCFDRHGTEFCEAFVLRHGNWARHKITCEQSGLAFRVCRKTCGFCHGLKPATVNYNSDIARNMKQCQRII